jgi:hypothetical protein
MNEPRDPYNDDYCQYLYDRSLLKFDAKQPVRYHRSIVFELRRTERCNNTGLMNVRYSMEAALERARAEHPDVPEHFIETDVILNHEHHMRHQLKRALTPVNRFFYNVNRVKQVFTDI